MKLWQRPWIRVMTGAMGGLALGVGLGRAQGVPTGEVLFFTGKLSQNGAPPAQASLPLGISLWDVALNGDTSTNRKCDVPSAQTPLNNGAFKLDLSSCAAAVAANPNLYVEVSVSGSPLPRQTGRGALCIGGHARRHSGHGGARERGNNPAGK